MAIVCNMFTLVLVIVCCITSQGFPFDDDWLEAGGMFNSQGMQNQGMQSQRMPATFDDDVYENAFYNQFLQYLGQFNPFFNPFSNPTVNTTSTATTNNNMMGYFYNPFMNFYNPFNSFYNLFDKKR